MEDFKNYEKMIFSFANHYSKLNHIDVDDLISVGEETYVWCLHHYEGSKKTKFSTYLYLQLGQRMIDEGHRMRRAVPSFYNDINTEENDNFEATLKSPDELPDSAKELLESSDSLSYEAKMILSYLLSFNWCSKRIANPTKSLIKKELRLSDVAMDSAWCELHQFWNEKGWKVA